MNKNKDKANNKTETNTAALLIDAWHDVGQMYILPPSSQLNVRAESDVHEKEDEIKTNSNNNSRMPYWANPRNNEKRKHTLIGPGQTVLLLDVLDRKVLVLYKNQRWFINKESWYRFDPLDYVDGKVVNRFQCMFD